MSTRSNRLRRIVSPVLALLLFACISWGATAEFTHHHGSPRPVAADTNASTAPDADADIFAFDSRDPLSASSRTSAGLDCLICQLHQNLSTATLEHPAGALATQSQTLSAPRADLLHISLFAARSHGRAPPRTSLS